MKLILCFVAVALGCASSSAGTITVTSLADNGPGSLRASIGSAVAGDVIQFDPALHGQVILLTTQLNIPRELRIEGPGADKITISGGNRTRIFFATAPLTLTGLNLKNGLGDGGALYVLRARANVIGCSFTENAAPNGLGAAVYNPGSPIQFSHCTFSKNTASGFGLGGAFCGSPNVPVTMTDCTFSNNSAHDGGAIFADAQLTLVRCLFSSNSIPTDGIAGAVFNEYPTFISGCVFTGNSTGEGGAGGALFLADGTIRDSLIAGNAVGSTSREFAQGGGIWTYGTLRIENSTIANNSSGAQSDGAGIYNDGFLILENSTISGNSAGTSSRGGGVFNEPGASVGVANTIIAGNSAPIGPDISGSFVSRGFNLIGNTTGNTGATADDLISIDPLLGPLQDNGGSSATMALLPRSPAIDHGDPAFVPSSFVPPMTTDQRGAIRVDAGRLDIGAYEAEPPHYPVIDFLTDPQTLECTSYSGTAATLSMRVHDRKGHPLVVQWLVNGEVRQTDQVPAGQSTSGGTSTYTAVFPDGVTDVTVVLDDGESDPVVKSTSVSVRDSTPPAITSISASPNVFSPPNHKMTPVTISVTASDVCDPNPTSQIIGVTSNEPGPGQYEITASLSLNVLLERNGGGDGRVYTITVQAVDDSGNATRKNVLVTVPKGKK